MTAYILCRTSIKKDNSFSIDYQLSSCKNICLSKKLFDKNIFIENGISSSSNHNIIDINSLLCYLSIPDILRDEEYQQNHLEYPELDITLDNLLNDDRIKHRKYLLTFK